MRHLSKVTDETTPTLSRDEIFALGRERLDEARTAAVGAIHAGSIKEFFQREPLDMYDLQKMRDAARKAALEWSRAEAALTEVLNEIDRSRRASRIIVTRTR